MNEPLQKIRQDSDLISGGVCGLLAALIMSYVGSVTSPGIVHLLLALIAVGAILAAYLFVARSKLESEQKGPAVLAGATLGIVCFLLLSQLY